MASPKNNYRRHVIRGIVGARIDTRPPLGSIMPFIAMSVILFLGTVGIATELTRLFETVRQIKFAAQTAALYACSLSTNSDGSYSLTAAQANIQAAVLAAGNAAWNKAECGPIGNVFSTGNPVITWNDPVSFAATDIQFATNPLDANEFFTQVTARRDNNDVLQQFFMPLLWLYSNPIGTQLSAQQYQANPHQTVEVLGQPASRIGAGAPANTQSGTPAANFIGWAALPVAISNKQFAAAADPSQTTITYTIDLVSPSNNPAAQAGHIKGCFVNLTAGSGTNYYSPSTGTAAVNQLISLLNYFSGGQAATAPALIEQGSQLNAFDPSSFSSSQQNQIKQALTPNKFYIVPVLANDPIFGGSNTIVGFARLNLDPINNSNLNPSTGAIVSLTVDIGESVPVYNATCASGFSAIPGNTANFLPAPVAPFMPRQYDPNSGGVTLRPRGVVLAPAVSPRQIKFS